MSNSVDFSGKASNIPMQVQPMEIFEISSDESINSDKTESYGDEQRSHNRKTIDPEWIKSYPWLRVEIVNEETTLYCEICRNQNGETRFARGTSSLRLLRIKEHLKTKEHKKSEELLEAEQFQSIQSNQLSTYRISNTAYDSNRNRLSQMRLRDLGIEQINFDMRENLLSVFFYFTITITCE
ncbi:15641_t:CDS:2 [Entrophospora sp. SA101]|nr:15641_t:CDS:2 [Entrophospora sp. SA101]